MLQKLLIFYSPPLWNHVIHKTTQRNIFKVLNQDISAIQMKINQIFSLKHTGEVEETV